MSLHSKNVVVFKWHRKEDKVNIADKHHPISEWVPHDKEDAYPIQCAFSLYVSQHLCLLFIYLLFKRWWILAQRFIIIFKLNRINLKRTTKTKFFWPHYIRTELFVYIIVTDITLIEKRRTIIIKNRLKLIYEEKYYNKNIQ